MTKLQEALALVGNITGQTTGDSDRLAELEELLRGMVASERKPLTDEEIDITYAGLFGDPVAGF